MTGITTAYQQFDAPQRTCSFRTACKRLYQAGSVAFAVLGNIPFYGVAATAFPGWKGKVLGVAEAFTYALYRADNLLEVGEKFTEKEEESAPCQWKQVAAKAGVTALGLIGQLPFVALTYYGNHKQLFYPIVSGVCESSFTILSLLLTLKALAQRGSPEQEAVRETYLVKCDHFLSELSLKYQDPNFDPTPHLGNPQLILQSEAIAAPRLDLRQRRLLKAALALGVATALYVTVANAAVSDYSIAKWTHLAGLGITAAIFVSCANIRLLGQICVDSAEHHLLTCYDLISGQYQRPLAGRMAPISWLAGRVVAVTLGLLSCGTTMVSFHDYVPSIGKELSYLAPISSELILHGCLSQISDKITLLAAAPKDERSRQFIHLQQNVAALREKIASLQPHKLPQLSQNPAIELLP